MESKVDKLERQPCPMCGQNTLTLMEAETDIPYFGKVFVFGMECSNCDFKKHDVEAASPQDPVKYAIEVQGEDDLKIRIVRSSEATIKIPHITTIEPGPDAQGFVTNVEGLFNQVKEMLETFKESTEDKDEKKKVWKLIKKVNRVLWGDEKAKIIIEDPSGNSAIVSDKAIKSKLKK